MSFGPGPVARMVGGLALLVLALACAGATAGAHPDRRAWRQLAALLALLALERWLDVFAIGTAAVRDWAQGEGWYGRRQGPQALFVALVLGLSALGIVALLRQARRRGVPLALALAGALWLLAFTLGRAASLHAVDAWLGRRVLAIPLNWWAQLFGLGLVAAGAMWQRSRAAAALSRAGT